MNPAVTPVPLTAQINSDDNSQQSALTDFVRIIEISKLNNSFPSSHTNETENYNKSADEDDLSRSKNSSIIEKETSPSNKDALTTDSTEVTENVTYHLNESYMLEDTSSNLSSVTSNVQISSESHLIAKKPIPNVIETKGASKYSELRLLDHSAEETVRVRMQNTSVTEGGATRLIYSVHLGGKPVPAETAARDMALLSPQEVALELGAPVLIQSERKFSLLLQLIVFVYLFGRMFRGTGLFHIRSYLLN